MIALGTCETRCANANALAAICPAGTVRATVHPYAGGVRARVAGVAPRALTDLVHTGPVGSARSVASAGTEGEDAERLGEAWNVRD